MYGEFGLKEGFLDKDGNRHGGGYFLKENPGKVYDRVTKAADPWADQRNPDGTDLQGSMFGDAFGGQNRKMPELPDDVVLTLECTLEDFYNGCVLIAAYEATQVQHDARTTKLVRCSQRVQVQPGYSESTELTYSNKGHEIPGMPATDLVIKFK